MNPRGIRKITAAATALLTPLLTAGWLVAGFAAPAQAAGTTYFVSASGSDTNSGTSSAAPWRSLSKINSIVLKPGDTVSFRRGDTWTGGIVTTQSGTSTAPITLNGYGSGSAPTITGGKSGNCIRINGNFTTVDGLRGVACGLRASASPGTAIRSGTPAPPTMPWVSRREPDLTSGNTPAMY
jgi:hypothetical protein